MKDRWSKYIQNLVYDFSRVFLLENHPYRILTSTFNGKPKRTQIPEIMSSSNWLRAYDKDKEKEIVEILNSIGEPMFDDPELFNTYVDKIPKGMKIKSIFYELPYWEHLNIVNLLYLMHIFKNVSCSLWIHISSKKMTSCLPREILFLQILKISIGQNKKIK